MNASLQPPNPQKLQLSTGDKKCTITVNGAVAANSENNVTLVLSIHNDPKITISLDAVTFGKSVQWTETMTTAQKNFKQAVFFRLTGAVAADTLCGLDLKATDANGNNSVPPPNSSDFTYN